MGLVGGNSAADLNEDADAVVAVASWMIHASNQRQETNNIRTKNIMFRKSRLSRLEIAQDSVDTRGLTVKIMMSHSETHCF